jgi:hypothetical protein
MSPGTRTSPGPRPEALGGKCHREGKGERVSAGRSGHVKRGQCVNGDAAESFRSNLWVKNGACSIHYERVLAVYIHLLQILICCHLPRLLPVPPVQLVINS